MDARTGGVARTGSVDARTGSVDARTGGVARTGSADAKRNWNLKLVPSGCDPRVKLTEGQTESASTKELNLVWQWFDSLILTLISELIIAS